MTTLRRLAPVALMIVIGAPAGPAHADSDADAHSGEGDFFADVRRNDDRSGPGADLAGDDSLGVYHSEPACAAICTGSLTCSDGGFKTHSWIELPDGSRTNERFWCPVEDQDDVTDHVVARAFRRIPLPSSDLVVQPPGGRTLVNFATNFYTEAAPFHRTVRLLGQRVELRIEAHSYTWRFDDGDPATTREPGAPYPELEVTHDYRRTGDYRPAVDTTWVADFRVNNGPWRPVPGSVTVSGDPVALEAIEARPTLVGYD